MGEHLPAKNNIILLEQSLAVVILVSPAGFRAYESRIF